MNHIDKFRSLSAREREVLDLFCQGFSQDDIGARLFISPKTVRAHMAHIYQKLDLMGLSPRTRAFTLREEYWPLHKSEPQPVEQPEPESEIIEPIPAEVEQIVGQDEGAMRALVASPPRDLEPPFRRARPRVSCLVWAVVLLIVIGGAFAYFGGWQWMRGWLAAQLLNTGTPTLQATQTSAQVTQQASSTLRATGTPSQTPTDSQTPPPTLSPTPRPSSTPDFGPIYEIGEWHKEGDLWFRVFEWGHKYDGIYFLVEMWNQSNQDEYFRWAPLQNGFLRDNLGNRYIIEQTFNYGEYNEIVSSGAKRFVTYGIYTDVTFVFESDNLFSTGVTDLFFTLEYFSDIERATWRIPIGG
jgi:hypothetical protein